MKKFDTLTNTILNEGVFSRVLGAAALAGALSTGTPAEAHPRNTQHTHQIQKTAKERGIRNNNPGNIKATREKWKGAIGRDGQFLKFNTMENGIRAMARTLRVYQNKYDINTIDGIIRRWAPRSNRNPTEGYINFISDQTNIDRNQTIDLNDDVLLYNLINAMIKFENGKSVPGSIIMRGIEAEKR